MDIEKIISNLYLKEKIAQISQILYLNNHEEVVERLKKEPIGSLIMATDALSGNKELDAVSEEKMNELQEISMKYHGIPLLFGTDIIHGYDITYPVPLAMTAAFDPEAVKEAFKNIAEEGRKGGINWTFTPMLDVSRDPRWGRVIEGPGEDPYLGEKLAESVVKGVQGDGDKVYMAACAKHYVGYGRSEGGRDYHSTDISDYQLRNYYLRAFKSAVKSGCSTVMNSFNEISGMPTAASRYLLTDVLRGEFGFEGFVISDWGAIVQLIRQGIARDKKDCAELSINAGLDMDMCDNCFYDNLKELVSEGKVSMETIDEAVRRVLRVKNSMGLFEEPYIPTKSMDLESHKKMLLEEQERLMELLGQAETIEDIISIESRLTEVRYQLESMESQLRTIDNKVTYSTIYLSINEVTRYTPPVEKGAWERMSSGFIENVYNVIDGFIEFGIGFVISIPVIIVYAVIITAAFLIFRLIRKRIGRKKTAKNEMTGILKKKPFQNTTDNIEESNKKD